MAQQQIRLALVGLGDIGIRIARVALGNSQIVLVGAADVDPAKSGRDLGEALALDRQLGVSIEQNAEAMLRRTRPNVAVVATASFLDQVADEIEAALDTGTNVVSTCEELVYPFATHPVIARDLDEAARRAGVAVLGAGVNPGFVMDLLPIVLTATSTSIRHITVRRVVDASARRATLQQRIGAGLDPLAFRDWLRQRTTPHVGLDQSLRMIADALGTELDRVSNAAEPIIAEEWVRTPFVTVAPGQVAGIHQTARGYAGRHEVLLLDWRTALGMTDTHDAVLIDGTPPIDVLIRGGIHGDEATAALVVRAVMAVQRAAPGLRTMLDLPPLHYHSPWLHASELRGARR